MVSDKHYTVKIEDFSSLGVSSDFLKKKINFYNLQYKKPSLEERDSIILKICKYLFEM